MISSKRNDVQGIGNFQGILVSIGTKLGDGLSIQVLTEANGFCRTVRKLWDIRFQHSYAIMHLRLHLNDQGHGVQPSLCLYCHSRMLIWSVSWWHRSVWRLMQDTHVRKRFHTGNGFLEIGVQINVKLQKVRMRIFFGKPATVTVLRSNKISYLSREASGACISCNFSNPKIFRSHRSQWLQVRKPGLIQWNHWNCIRG